MNLNGKRILITGAARRVGRELALAAAKAGAQVLIHHGHSTSAGEQTRQEILQLGGAAQLLQADLSDAEQCGLLIEQAFEDGPLFGLVNSAAIFEPHTWKDTTLQSWQEHFSINLTAPFLLSQAFARSLPAESDGRIVNILDWRALRPGPDHLPYTISKAGLVALTRSLAQAFAPRITVNGLALGAILPPSDGAVNPAILQNIPSGRWAASGEVGEALVFLLGGPAYITGEIIHVDGGRHLV